MPVLTDDALRFVGALTFSALASEPARTSLFDAPEPIPHTRLGQTADLVVVAPATAKLLGKYAAGISDDLLTATLLATRAPVLVAPAMHTEMWEHPAVQDNLATLRRRGVHVVDPDSRAPRRRRRRGGPPRRPRAPSWPRRRACSLGGRRPRRGAGARHRRRHPRADRRGAGHHQPLVGQAGLRDRRGRRPPRRRRHPRHHHRPARAARRRDRVACRPRRRCRTRCSARAADWTSSCMAAAVADFRPKAPPDRKLKKHEGVPEIVLEPTHDFLVDLGRDKRAGQVLVGFAAETDDLVANAAEQAAQRSASTSSSATTSPSPTPASKSTPTARSSSTPTGGVERAAAARKIRPRRGHPR